MYILSCRPTTSSRHTLERKPRKTGTLGCKENDQKLRISDFKDVNKRKKHRAPLKLESKKMEK